MSAPPPTPHIGAVVFESLSATDAAGNPATFAVIDQQGQVILAGPEVARAAWRFSVDAYRNHLKGLGHLRVLECPDVAIEAAERA